MKAVRYITLTIVALVFLVVAAIAVALLVIDPNTYRPQIEKAVEDNTNLDLNLAGDIGWSLIPLGLELNEVEATLDGDRLMRLERLVAKIDFWSLIEMSPRVHTFVLDGLDARLRVAEDGTGNWTRIMPEPAPGEQAQASMADSAQDDTPAPTTPETTSEPLNFNVEEVQISNARVHYEDLATGQSVTLENFALSASQITLGQAFPLETSFSFASGEPALNVDGKISARLSANEALNRFEVSGLDSQFSLGGEPFSGKSVQARLTGTVSANLEDEVIDLTELRATLANLQLNTSLVVTGFGEQTAISGKIDIGSFSPKELLSNLGQASIETTDPTVLNAVALETDIGGPPGEVRLSNLKITLDDTVIEGDARYALASSATSLNLQANAINVDRYLPPKAEETEQATSEETAGPETDLLPLETLRELALDINLQLGELIASNLTITEIKTGISAGDGVLKVEPFSGKLYDGDFSASVTIDASTDNPEWTITKRINSVQILPLLTNLAEVDLASGAANLAVDVTTDGNRISALRENADGEIRFDLAEGELTQMNLTRLACKGIAMVNQETLAEDDWGTKTPFNDMKGTLKINGNTLNNTSLVAALAGMSLEGEGTVDLAESLLDYELGLRIVGEIHRDKACRVTDTVKNVVIPVECRGNFSEDPAGLCSFDGSRFRDTLKDIAANAARKKVKEKVNEEVDRAVEGKVQKELEKHLNEEDTKKVKDAIKGLFK